MSPHGKGHDRYQFIFRLKRDSLPQLHDATSATRDPFPPFRMAWNSIFSKPIQLCGRASRNRIRVWHSCSPWFKLSPLSIYLRRLAIKNISNFSSSIIISFDFRTCNYLRSFTNLTYINETLERESKLYDYVIDRREHLFTRNTSYKKKFNNVYDVILFDKVHASTR